MSDNIHIKPPDGSEKEMPKGSTALDVARSISLSFSDPPKTILSFRSAVAQRNLLVPGRERAPERNTSDRGALDYKLLLVTGDQQIPRG